MAWRSFNCVFSVYQILIASRDACRIDSKVSNALLKDIHDRMPVILSPDDFDLWLDPGLTDPMKISGLLKPFDARLMRVYTVSSTVNKVENDGPECAEEIAASEPRSKQTYFEYRGAVALFVYAISRVQKSGF